jgi:tetratricopeptide (TPR) repeat protein
MAAVVFLLAALLYLPALRNGFVWDDVYLVGHPDIRVLDVSTVKRIFTTNFWETMESQSGMYRPLTTLSFYADHQIYGETPAGFHLTNVLLNAAVSALALLLLLEMFGRVDVAFVSALVFLAFPMHVENVAWVSGRTDLLATLFMLSSLWCYARWRAGRRTRSLAGALAGFAAALLAKETAVVLPAVVACTEIIPAGRAQSDAPRWKRWMVIACMFAMVALYFALRTHVLGSALLFFSRFTTGGGQAAALTLSIVAHYAYKLLFPFRLDAEADFYPPETLWNFHSIAGVAVVAASLLAVYRWRRSGAVVFGVTVMALGLAPVLNILPLNQVLAERFLYFPSLGYALLLSLACGEAVKRRIPVTAALSVFLVACAARTVARTLDWKDELTLFRKTVEVSGDNARAHASLGTSLYQRERYEEAVAEFRRATEINPAYAPGWNGLARSTGKLGRVQDAVGYAQTAVELDPNNALYFHNLGVLRFQALDYGAAAASFRRALELRPRHLHARFNLGLSLYQLRDFDGAAREFTALENKDTDFPNAYFFLSESELQRGHRQKAARAAAHFLSLHSADDAMASRARTIAGMK